MRVRLIRRHFFASFVRGNFHHGTRRYWTLDLGPLSVVWTDRGSEEDR